ncbi:unnamed protein product [marine sediment metagenome]|uniref:Uncharacterized protein n=1 Tax=marine sediment metagenome TaxID=412755 RepID=X1FHE3_9ZZZZ
MKANMTEPENKQDNDVRDIPKWERRYVWNRPTLPSVALGVLPILILYGILFCAVPLISAGYEILGLVTIAVVVGLCGLGMWFLRTYRRRTGDRRSIEQAWNEWVYREEGSVSVSEETRKREAPWVKYLLLGVGALLLGATFAGWRLAPPRYWVPVSSVLVVFVLAQPVLRPGRSATPTSWLFLLWPLLYTLHAVLILAGVPLYLTGPYEGLTMWVSLGVCALIAALTAHIYSRYALRRLRTLAQSPDTTGGGQ